MDPASNIQKNKKSQFVHLFFETESQLVILEKSKRIKRYCLDYFRAA